MLPTEITLLDVEWAWNLISPLFKSVAPLLSVTANAALPHRAGFYGS